MFIVSVCVRAHVHVCVWCMNACVHVRIFLDVVQSYTMASGHQT